jgi:hypothetical protein
MIALLIKKHFGSWCNPTHNSSNIYKYYYSLKKICVFIFKFNCTCGLEMEGIYWTLLDKIMQDGF